jgi:hypothetical protein
VNRVVVITGASSGIGNVTAKLFLEKGDIVYGLSRRVVGESFNEIQCDITNEEEVKSCISNIIEKEGKIDVLVNNAGMGISGPVETTKIDDVKNSKEDKIVVSTLETQTTLSHNNIFRAGEIASLSILIPTEINPDYISKFEFTSGSTATEFTAPTTIKWTGDDIVDNSLVPTQNKRYSVFVYSDGEYIRGISQGVML